MNVRRAVADDIPQMLELAEERRRLYETYQPTLWRSAPNAKSAQGAYFKTLISNRKNAIVLVYENAGVVHGFIVATLIEAPPVYAPGGKTCLIDDFAVTQNNWDKAGRALMDEAHGVARAAGAIQTVVVCGHLDEAKREFLGSQDLSIASEWFVKNL
jgi:hypothetical protein